MFKSFIGASSYTNNYVQSTLLKAALKLLIGNNKKASEQLVQTINEYTSSSANSSSKWQQRKATKISTIAPKKMSRTWVQMKGADARAADNKPPYTLLSYNILAQDLLVEHLHLYVNIEQAMLRWDHRLARLTEEIQHIKPDIICLQEMQFNHLKSLVKHIRFNRQLEYVYKKKTGHRTDGCAIIYDRSKFRLLAERPVEYLTDGHAVLNRDNVALLAKFALKNQPEREFVVATTHLLYNPKRQDVRIAQVNKLLAAMHQFSMSEKANGKTTPLPVILTGDFNFEPYTTPFKLLSSPYRPTRSLANRRSGEQSPCTAMEMDGEGSGTEKEDFISQEKGNEHYSRLPNGEEIGEERSEVSLQMTPLDFGPNTASTFQNTWITVDYILHSTDEHREKIQIGSVYRLPKIQDCIKGGLIPNKYTGSDHYSLGIKFSLS